MWWFGTFRRLGSIATYCCGYAFGFIQRWQENEMRFRSLTLAVLILAGAGAVAAYYFPREEPVLQPTDKQGGELQNTEAQAPQPPSSEELPQPQSTAEAPKTAGNGEHEGPPQPSFPQKPTSDMAQTPEPGEIKQFPRPTQEERSPRPNPPSSSGLSSPSSEVAKPPDQTKSSSAASGHEPDQAPQQQAILPPNELSSMSVRSLQEALSCTAPGSLDTSLI